MVQLVCSDKIYEKLSRELLKRQIDIVSDSSLVLVERGYDIPDGKISIVFDALDYMEASKLLSDGISRESNSIDAVTGFYQNRFAVILPKDILYLESGADGILCFTSQDHYSMKETLQHYETLWKEKGFIRINKSQLVNLAHVRDIIPWFNSRYVLRMDHGAELEVSRMYAKKLREALKI
ncbi:MAG TPA: LytTR family transcriptional regulator [Clostridiales bacterium]|jgi:two-component system response regulator LytT|nr:LytTR family transcriptional regulator [Clostridiales bacterium]